MKINKIKRVDISAKSDLNNTKLTNNLWTKRAGEFFWTKGWRLEEGKSVRNQTVIRHRVSNKLNMSFIGRR